MPSTRYSREVRLDDLNNVHSFAVLAVPPRSRVLDIGGADGSVARVLAARGARVTVVERDADALEALRAAGVEVVGGDVEHLADEALGVAAFDVVLLLDVLEHLVHPAELLARVARWLVPGGLVMISVPNVAHGAVRVSLLQGRFPRPEVGLLDRTHLHFFDRAQLDALLAGAALAPLDVLTVERDLDQTELDLDLEQVPADVRHALGADPSARVYQYFVIARPGAPDAPGSFGASGGGLLQAMTERVRAVEDAYRRLEAHAGQVEAEASARRASEEQRAGRIDDLEIEGDTLRRLLRERMAELDQASDTIAVLQRDLAVQRSYADSLAAQVPGIAARGGEAQVLADLDAYRAVAATPRAAAILAAEAHELARLRGTLALRLVARADATLRRVPALRRIMRAAAHRLSRLSIDAP